MTKNINRVVILNNIRSNENVGSIFRTVDAAGVSKIILCGYTPAPTDRFGRENKGFTKASLGAEKSVKWEKTEDLKNAIKNLKNFVIVGVEQDKKAIDYRKIKDRNIKNIALVFGNEVYGVDQEVMTTCEGVIEVPQLGTKHSFNISVTVGIVLWELLRDKV